MGYESSPPGQTRFKTDGNTALSGIPYTSNAPGRGEVRNGRPEQAEQTAKGRYVPESYEHRIFFASCSSPARVRFVAHFDRVNEHKGVNRPPNSLST